MCRSIRNLHNFEPPATTEEVHAAALQYVRKVSGMQKPSQVNTQAFDTAVADIADVTNRLIENLAHERTGQGSGDRGGQGPGQGRRPRRDLRRPLRRSRSAPR